MQNEIEIAVVLSCEHDAKVVVTHTKHDDVVYQRPGEAPSTGIGGVEGLRRHCSVPLFGRGPSPRDRRLSVAAEGRDHREDEAAARRRNGPFMG